MNFSLSGVLMSRSISACNSVMCRSPFAIVGMLSRQVTVNNNT